MASLSCLELLPLGLQIKPWHRLLMAAVLADKLYLLIGSFGPDFSLDYYISQGKFLYPQGKVEALQTGCNGTTVIFKEKKKKKS